MRNLRYKLATAAAAVTASIAPIVIAGPSEALPAAEWPTACGDDFVTTSTNPAKSTVLAASGGCTGLWVTAGSDTQKFRGQYYKGGAWRQSSIGWKTAKNVNSKIIGDTTTGRKLRAEAYSKSGGVYATW